MSLKVLFFLVVVPADCLSSELKIPPSLSLTMSTSSGIIQIAVNIVFGVLATVIGIVSIYQGKKICKKYLRLRRQQDEAHSKQHRSCNEPELGTNTILEDVEVALDDVSESSSRVDNKRPVTEGQATMTFSTESSASSSEENEVKREC